jgi:hypothetical protein
VLRAIAAGFDLKSVLALTGLLAVGSVVGLRWSDLVELNGAGDALLYGIWAVLALLVVWRVEPRRDLVLVLVGLAGGTAIESWGTQTRLWVYFTEERPPLWILPAWPVAALAIDRLAGLLDLLLRGLPARRGAGAESRQPADAGVWRGLRWVGLGVFVVAMSRFAWPTVHLFGTQLVIGLMVALAIYAPDPRRDVLLFIAGSALGALLEYWGTSRECWTYYTREVPPIVCVFAHGFAATAFSRTAAFVQGSVLPRALRSAQGRLAQRRLAEEERAQSLGDEAVNVRD